MPTKEVTNISEHKIIKKKLSDNDKRIFAETIRNHIFDLSMLCKDQKWHKTGLLLCAASDELDKMLNEQMIEQVRFIKHD